MTKLLETLLTSEFTFGFELEAYAPKSIINQCIVSNDVESRWNMNSNEAIWGLSNTDDEDEEDSEDEDRQWWDENDEENEDEIDIEKLFNEIKYIFSQYFGSDIKIVSDGSLGTGGFEFPTPPMSLTPSNIQHCIKFLNEIHKKYGIYTDETCGFHVHFSFPQMNKKDMAWIICQIAINDNYIHELTQFTTDYDSIEFLSAWAKTDFLDEIRNCINKNDGNLPDFNKLSSILSSDKYRLLRIHPQGTLEWRGPRNFMNEGNINLIYEFFYKILRVSRMFADCMDKKYLGNYLNRSSFDKIIDFSNIDTKLSDMKYNNNSDIYTKIAQKTIKNPTTLLKLKDYNNFDYITLLATIKAICTQYNDKSLESILIDLRYKPFKSSLLLAEIVNEYPDFLNYISYGLSKIINTSLFKNIYNLIGKAKNIKPEIIKEIVLIMKKSIPLYNLHSFVTAIEENPHSKNLTKKSTIQEFINIYGKDKVENAFKRKGFNLSDYLK